MTALLACEAARIDVGGAPLLEGASFAVEGRTVALLGDWQALFLLFGGTARVSAGRVLVAGEDAESAAARGALGFAALDPPLPGDWTAERYVSEGLQLSGAKKRSTRETVRLSLATLGLAPIAGRRLSTLAPAERRALVIALAGIESPPVLAIQDPFAGLYDEPSRQFLAAVMERARAGRSLLLSSSAPPQTGVEHALLAASDQALSYDAGTPVAVGTFADLTAPGDHYLVSVTEHGSEFAERLSTAGIEAKPINPGALAPLGTARLLVKLTEPGATRALIDAALEAGAPIIELRPLAVAPSPSER
jgi:ABC-type multidrug transport system ATPase subunit